MTTITGMVEWFDTHTGEIKGDDGFLYVVNAREIIRGQRFLSEGERVGFTPAVQDGCPIATAVVRV